MNWYLEVLKKYAEFEGRARPAEYWFFTLFQILIFMALYALGFAIGIAIDEPLIGLVPYMIYAFATMIPGIAVTVRRLHDTDKSGLWFLISFIPCGGLILLVFMIQEGTRGPNQFGPDPIRSNRRRSRPGNYDDDYDDYDDEDEEPIRRRRPRRRRPNDHDDEEEY